MLSNIQVDLSNLKIKNSLVCAEDIQWDTPVWPIENNILESRNLLEIELIKLKNSIANSLNEFGGALVEFKGMEIYGEAGAGIVTRLLSCFGTPIKVFDNEYGHWRKIDVDVNRPASKSRGIGNLPLHMDFVNAENPPDLVSLFCVRRDPAGGGNSLISRHIGFEKELSTRSIKLLKQKIFHDGKVINLSNIGKDINPFSVYCQTSRWRFRYTSNLLHLHLPVDVLQALNELEEFLSASTYQVELCENQMLLIDQHYALHGRESLGGNQAEIPTACRRLVHHSFVRYN